MKPGNQVQRLFVYGTLAPGRANHEVLASIPGSWDAATLKGILFDEGWGAKLGCPGIVPDATGDEVDGFVLSSTDLPQHWQRLDAFEGEGYERVPVTVRIDGTGAVDAWVYALRRGD